MQLDLLRDGRARLSVIEWAKDTPKDLEVYSLLLERKGSALHAEPVAAR